MGSSDAGGGDYAPPQPFAPEPLADGLLDNNHLGTALIEPDAGAAPSTPSHQFEI